MTVMLKIYVWGINQTEQYRSMKHLAVECYTNRDISIVDVALYQYRKKIKGEIMDVLVKDDVLTQEFVDTLEKKYLFKNFEIDTKAKKDRGFLKGYASTYEVDEGNDQIIPGAFTQDLHLFSKNPIMLFSHQLSQILGSWTHQEEQTAGLYVEGEINLKTDLGKYVYTLISAKDVKGMSIGYSVSEGEIEEDSEIVKLLRIRLWEISIVSIPMNQSAWITGTKLLFTGQTFDTTVKDGKLTDIEVKKVIPFKDYGYDEENEGWQAGKETRDAEVTDLKRMCGWYDAEKPTEKSSYKLPHHRLTGNKAVWRGVASAMGSLLGARGGVDIPDEDRKGVYNHLAKHYKDLEKKTPEFKGEIEDVQYKDVEWQEDEKFLMEEQSLKGSLQADINIIKYFMKEDRIKSVNPDKLAEMQELLNLVLDNQISDKAKSNPPEDTETNSKEMAEVVATLDKMKVRLAEVRKFDVNEAIKTELKRQLATATGKDLK